MSPDQYSFDKRLEQLRSAGVSIDEFDKQLGTFLKNPENDFRGLVVMIGNAGDYLAIAKRFGEDGSPEIIFASAESPIESLLNLGVRIGQSQWKEDKRSS